MSKDCGGFAFPSPLSGGMTLRDCFALEAMKEMAAKHCFTSLADDPKESIYEETARRAYHAADAMIAERNK